MHSKKPRSSTTRFMFILMVFFQNQNTFVYKSNILLKINKTNNMTSLTNIEITSTAQPSPFLSLPFNYNGIHMVTAWEGIYLVLAIDGILYTVVFLLYILLKKLGSKKSKSLTELEGTLTYYQILFSLHIIISE